MTTDIDFDQNIIVDGKARTEHRFGNVAYEVLNSGSVLRLNFCTCNVIDITLTMTLKRY